MSYRWINMGKKNRFYLQLLTVLSTISRYRFRLWKPSWVIFFVGVLLISCQSKDKHQPLAQNGQIDFSAWNFEQDGIATLNGEWNFYWGSLPNHTNALDTIKHAGISLLPRFWTEVSNEGTYFEQNGFATYHLTLQLPDTIQQYSLKINAAFTAYALWEEGKLLTSVGTVGTTAEQTKTAFQTKRITLPQKKEINLFLQIASWEHTKGGGIIQPIRIGTTTQIHQIWLNKFILQLISFAIISGLAIYLIILYFFYLDHPSYLYVGLFALLGAFRAICVDEMVIQDIFSNFPYYWNQRLRYIGFFASIGFIILAVREFFQGYVAKYIVYGAYTLFVFSLATLIIPFSWSSYLSPFFQAVCVLVSSYCLHTLYQTIRDGKNVTEALIFSSGGIIVFITMLHYLLYVHNIVQGALYHNIGYMAFIFSQVIILAYKSKRTYNKANSLSQELVFLNKNLEFKVEERTQEIEVQKNQITHQAHELALVNEKLQELDEAKNHFFANISHELRTPLTLILGGISKIKKEVSNKGVELIEKQATLLHQLINQLLDLIKLEAGKMQSNKSKQPIVKLLRKCFYSFESLADFKKIRLDFRTNIAEFEMLIDKQALEQIVYNLLSNAYKFTPEFGEISLQINSTAQSLNFTIQDTGLGIPEKELPFIFDRFYQVDTSMQKSHQGTGIGLALVKELVKLQDGQIDVQSKEGIGTTFSLSFPIETAEAAQQYEQETSAQQEAKSPIFHAPSRSNPASVIESSTSQPILLIVEDHPDLQELIAEEFQEEYQLLQATDGQMGWEMATEHIPDIIISDVMMPHKNGYELCEALKTDERTSHIPLVLLTARTAQENKLQGLMAGADDYLGKPFDTQELHVRAQNLIHSRQVLRKKYAQQGQDGLVKEVRDEVLKNPADKRFMDKLLHVIENHYSDEQFDVLHMAEAIQLNKRQLYRKLSAISGITPSKMLQNFRLQKAKEILSTQDIRIKEVGFMVGFSSQSYFNKCFKQAFDITPKEFQNQC